jgi:hypothetical protein
MKNLLYILLFVPVALFGQFTDVNGINHSIEDYLTEGKYVVIHCMGTWNWPCQNFAPDFGLGYLSYGCNTENVVFISIDSGSDNQSCIDFQETYMPGVHGLPIISGIEGGGDDYHSWSPSINSLPTVRIHNPNTMSYIDLDNYYLFYEYLSSEGIQQVLPSEYCEFDYTINGCTDLNAINYNSSANTDNGTCEYSSIIYDSLNNTIDEATTSLSSLQQALDTWNTTIDLSAGWNMFGYGCPNPINIAEGLSNHTDIISIVKDNNGNVYMPEFSFNGIGDLTPGFGYQIKVTEAIEGFSLCDWYVNDIPEDNIVSLQEEVASLQDSIIAMHNDDCIEEGFCWFDIETNTCYDGIEGFDCLGNWNLQIGDFYQGGVVFHIDETGQHGLTASIDGIIDLSWGCNGLAIDGADGQSLGTGLQNTIDIISHCDESPIAASYCYDYILNDFDDWHLPSRNEMSLMITNIGINTLSNEYWSSSEYSYAYAQSVYGSSWGANNKFQIHSVIPIRSF